VELWAVSAISSGNAAAVRHVLPNWEENDFWITDTAAGLVDRHVISQEVWERLEEHLTLPFTC
jgi:hypothetical protein